MVALVSLLVLACALAINAQAPSGCSTAQIGSISSNPQKLVPITLAPGVADWKIDIPEVPQCPQSSVGVKAVACDADVAPTLTFANKNLLYVHRNGNLAGNSGVVVTVYCPDTYNGGSGANSLYNQHLAY